MEAEVHSMAYTPPPAELKVEYDEARVSLLPHPEPDWLGEYWLQSFVTRVPDWEDPEMVQPAEVWREMRLLGWLFTPSRMSVVC